MTRRLRLTPARTLLLAVLALLLAGGWILGPAASAHAAPAAPQAPADCSLIYGPAKEYCEKADNPEADDPDPKDCKVPPTAQRPDDGVQGYFSDPPKNTPTPIDPKNPRARYHLYAQYGMAGLTWSNYDTGCIGDAGAWAETAAANVLMDGARWWTGLALELQKQVSDNYLSRLNPVFEDATKALRNAVFEPWIGVSVLALGSVLIWQARRRDLHASLQAAGWALMVTTIATAAFSYPAEAGRLADTAITGTVGQVQQAVTGDRDNPGDPATSHGNLLNGSLLYDQWLRGQLGTSDSPVAKKYGMQLYDAQTLSWAETRLPPKTQKKVLDAKAQTWTRIADRIKKEDSGAYGHLTGHSSGRIGSAAMAGLSIAPAAAFAIAVGAVLAASLLVVRLVVLFAPAIAPIALHRRAAAAMGTLGRSLAAALVHAPLFALAGAVDVLLIRALLSPDSRLPTWFAVVLMWVATYMLWRMAKPLRSMQTLVSPGHNYLGAGVGAVSAAGNTVKGAAVGYVKSRLTARQMSRYLGGGRSPESAGPIESPDRPRPPDFPDRPARHPVAVPDPTPPTASGPHAPAGAPGHGGDTTAAEDPTPMRVADGEGLRTTATPGGYETNYTPVTPTPTSGHGAGRRGSEEAGHPAPAPMRTASGTTGGEGPHTAARNAHTRPAVTPPAPASGSSTPTPGQTPAPDTATKAPHGPRPTAARPQAPAGDPPRTTTPTARPEPFIAQPTTAADGTTVHTIWTPSSGYTHTPRDNHPGRTSTPGEEQQ